MNWLRRPRHRRRPGRDDPAADASTLPSGRHRYVDPDTVPTLLTQVRPKLPPPGERSGSHRLADLVARRPAGTPTLPLRAVS